MATDYVERFRQKKKAGPYEDRPCAFNFVSQGVGQAFADIFLQITSPLNPAPRRTKLSGPGTDLELPFVLAVWLLFWLD